MKKLAIYFSLPGRLDYPFDSKEYYESYIEIIEELKNKGVKTYIVRANSYQGDGIFLNYFFWDGKKVVAKKGRIKVDLIYNKDNLNTIPVINDCPIINHPDFDNICRDKFKTFELFSDISPKTLLVNSYEEAIKSLTKFKDSKIVLKERFGEEGRGIFIIDKKDIKEKLYRNWTNILMQEFMDSSMGIPGIVDGIHDISVAVVNKKMTNGLLRQPAKGSYLANLKLGGTCILLAIDDVPKEILQMLSNIIDKIFNFYPVIFRADFMNTKNGFKLLELNSRPGLSHKKFEGEDYWKFNGAIVDCIVQYFNNK